VFNEIKPRLVEEISRARGSGRGNLDRPLAREYLVRDNLSLIQSAPSWAVEGMIR